MQPYCITFAGVPGSSKSIVAHYLSESFGLPIYSNDNLRFEVREDLLADNINDTTVLAEFERRRHERMEAMLARKRPFILDASVDRSWTAVQSRLRQSGFRYLIINMELSTEFLEKLYRETGRPKAIKILPHYMEQHREFMRQFAREVGPHITDATFTDRCEIAKQAVTTFIGDKLV